MAHNKHIVLMEQDLRISICSMMAVQGNERGPRYRAAALERAGALALHGTLGSSEPSGYLPVDRVGDGPPASDSGNRPAEVTGYHDIRNQLAAAESAIPRPRPME
jgi:hypothetical protein